MFERACAGVGWFVGHTFSTNSFFCNTLTCMDNYIWQFLIQLNLDSSKSHESIFRFL